MFSRTPSRRTLLFALLAVIPLACKDSTGPDTQDDLEVGPNQMLIRVTGDVEEEHLIDLTDLTVDAFASATQVEVLDHPQWTASYMYGQRVPAGTGSVNVRAAFGLSGELRPATQRLSAGPGPYFVIADLPGLSTAIGYLFREDETTTDDRLYFYPAEDGTLEITSAEPAGTVFDPTGAVEGTARFSAEEVEERWSDALRDLTYTPTGRSVEVEIAFHIPAAIQQAGYMDLTLSGGPYAPGTAVSGLASAQVDGGVELSMEMVTRDPADGGDGFAYVLIAMPAEGAFAVGEGVLVNWEVAGATNLFASAESGTVIITEYTPAGTDQAGEVRGSLDVTLRVYDAGGTIQMSGDFAAPMLSTVF